MGVCQRVAQSDPRFLVSVSESRSVPMETSSCREQKWSGQPPAPSFRLGIHQKDSAKYHCGGKRWYDWCYLESVVLEVQTRSLSAPSSM